MKKLLTLLTFFAFNLSFFMAEVMAQAPPPSSNPPGAPIDGFVSLLLMAGVGYGIREFKK